MNIKELKNELKNEYKFKVELHAHTSPASSCSQIPPEEMVKIYKSLGYDAVTLANHFMYEYCSLSKKEMIDRFFSDFEKASETGEKLGIKVILAAEIRFTENDNDYLVFGFSREAAEEIYDYLPYGVDNFRNNYKMPDSVFLQAHPFRNGMEKVNPEILDGIEVFNMHPNHNSRIGLASLYAAECNFPIITAGTDFHHLNRQHEGLSAIRTKTLPENSYDLARLLKSGDYLFEIAGNNIVLP